MNATAYVLINVEAGKGRAVMEKVAQLKSVSDVEAVLGPYDLIASVSGSDYVEIGRLVIDHLQKIDGVQKTLTCNVVNFEQ